MSSCPSFPIPNNALVKEQSGGSRYAFACSISVRYPKAALKLRKEHNDCTENYIGNRRERICCGYLRTHLGEQKGWPQGSARFLSGKGREKAGCLNSSGPKLR
jgi:hypothetical protein